jgi:hypothetical protein
MILLTHTVGIVRVTTLHSAIELSENVHLYLQFESLVKNQGFLLVTCKGAVFVMPWYEVKTEFESIANWYKLEAPLVKKPYFRIKTLPKPIGNEEILTALYAEISHLE